MGNQREQGCQSSVEVTLFGGITHTLQGAVCSDDISSREDLSRRALWYLRCPGYENAFEVDAQAAAAEEFRAPSLGEWRREGSGVGSDPLSEAQQKTATQKTQIMRMQNRLQRAYGKELSSGVGVWQWSYEFPEEQSLLCRAT